MSAILLDPFHIHALVSAAASPRFARGSGCLTFTHGSVQHTVHGTHACTAIGQALTDLNLSSVATHGPLLATAAHIYHHRTIDADYLTAANVLRLIAHYRYQVTDAPDWREHLATAFLHALEVGVTTAIADDADAPHTLTASTYAAWQHSQANQPENVVNIAGRRR